MESIVDTADFKLKEAKVIAKETKERAHAIEAKAQAIEVQVTFAETWAVDEYKKSKDFKYEVIKGIYNAFQLGFVECKKKVSETFSKLDLDSIIAIELEQEEEGEDEGEAEDAKEADEGGADARDEQAIQETIGDGRG